MKQILTLMLALCAVSAAMTQTVTTGKIENLKDAWDVSINYVGEIKNGKPNGLGMAIYSNDYVMHYVGYFVNGKYEGKGVLLYKDGFFLSGEWKAGKLNGQGAQLTSDKDFYIGGFVNGQKSGFGTYMYSDNSFLQGDFKTDTYNGRCVFINRAGDIISDNIYQDGKKNGPGYQYEVKDKKLYEGTWSNGDWQNSGTTYYKSFLKDERFYGEKTDNQVLAGIIDRNNKDMLEDTAYFYDLVKKKRYFGYYHNGFLDKGIIIKDDSTRFMGTINDDGAYGKGYFLKLGKYYDEGNYVKDHMVGDNNLSIDLEKKTVYYGQTNADALFTGKAWFANKSHDLYNGTYSDGKFTGQGWRLDKNGFLISGTWDDGQIVKVDKMVNEKGEVVNTNPKTLGEALAIVSMDYKTEFFSTQGNDDDNNGYSWMVDLYKGLINFPRSKANLIGGDLDEYYYYMAEYDAGDDEATAKRKYKELCQQIKSASVVLQKGAAPLKLSGTVNEPGDDVSFTTSSFTYPTGTKGFENFAVSAVLLKDDGEIHLLLVCGNSDGVNNWESDLK